MAQGKMKVKSKLPAGVKGKGVQKNPGSAITRRSNAPIQSKKNKTHHSQKLKQIITKTVNKKAEEEVRAMSKTGDNKKLSAAQQAVARHNQNIAGSSSAT